MGTSIKPTVKAVFLDIDNTLLDFDAYCREAMQNGFAAFGLGTYSEDMYAVFESTNLALWRQIEDRTLDFATLEKIRWQRVFAKLGIDFDGLVFEKYFRDCLFDSAILIDSAMEILTYLGKKYILCAASNGPYSQQMHRLETAGISHAFTHVFISEELGASKPAKAFFDKAFMRLNDGREPPVSRKETVMLGDSLTSDVRGGIDAGMLTIWYDRKAAGNPTDICPTYTVQHLSGVREIL